MAINGNNILVYKGSTVIAGVKSNEISCDCELIEISSPSTGSWKQYIVGRKEWSLTVGYLVLSSVGVRELLNVGTSYSLKIKGRSDSDSNGVSGTAYMKTCKITATKGNLVQGSFQFVGTSALT